MGDKPVLHLLVQCQNIVDFWVYVKQRDVSQGCPNCALDDETVLRALVQQSGIVDFWCYVDRSVPYVVRNRLSTDPIFLLTKKDRHFL